jgi:hypothetical protein
MVAITYATATVVNTHGEIHYQKERRPRTSRMGKERKKVNVNGNLMQPETQ